MSASILSVIHMHKVMFRMITIRLPENLAFTANFHRILPWTLKSSYAYGISKHSKYYLPCTWPSNFHSLNEVPESVNCGRLEFVQSSHHNDCILYMWEFLWQKAYVLGNLRWNVSTQSLHCLDKTRFVAKAGWYIQTQDWYAGANLSEQHKLQKTLAKNTNQALGRLLCTLWMSKWKFGNFAKKILSGEHLSMSNSCLQIV